MTSRERVIRALTHQPVDRAPRDLWVAPGVEMLRADELAEMNFRYPSDMVQPEFRYPRGHRVKGTPYEAGQYVDPWGCVWQSAKRGSLGEVKSHPLADLAALPAYRPPWELLERANLGPVNRGCAATSRFVLAWTEVRPFERMELLHGSAATRAGLLSPSRPLRELLAMVHEFSRREIELWASSDVDGVAFRDDWGSSHSLLIPVQTWRELFKPLYRQYVELIHAHDKFAFFHSDGNITEIFEDLVEIGIDAINAELFLMDLDMLAEKYRGRVTFWGGIDRQRVLPFGTPEEVRGAVRRMRAALDFGRGGVIAQCTWGLEVPFKNVAAVFEQWLAPAASPAGAE
ncbi:MAG: uroporphyrinogen decarboxylase family protein [Thermoguttaceae bacterium]